jgi:pimeloyl-ACP methyl ester carboxylesterase
VNGCIPTGTYYLVDQFKVYVVDRRWRNDSRPQGEEYSLTKEFEDVIALLDKTQASFLFGHSSGAVITLNVACRYPLAKIALYEPPLYYSTKWLPEAANAEVGVSLVSLTVGFVYRVKAISLVDMGVDRGRVHIRMPSLFL